MSNMNDWALINKNYEQYHLNYVQSCLLLPSPKPLIDSHSCVHYKLHSAVVMAHLWVYLWILNCNLNISMWRSPIITEGDCVPSAFPLIQSIICFDDDFQNLFSIRPTATNMASTG